MPITSPRNTLAYQLQGRPLSRPRSMEAIASKTVADVMDTYLNGPSKTQVHPETEAIWFYLYAHAMRELALAYDLHEPLPAEALAICDEYHRIAGRVAQRALYYLTIITAREARHCKSTSYDKVKAAIQEAGLHPKTLSALTHYQDAHAPAVTTSVLRNHLDDAPITDTVHSIRLAFYKGSYSGGFGGKAWGKVTDCLEAYVKGETSAEVMLDTVWTLAHNNGPIFNKGFLYLHQDNDALLEVLDLQRAGMIPKLMYVQSGIKSVNYVTDAQRDVARRVAKLLPKSTDFAHGAIDWQKVKELGAVGYYDKYIPKTAQATPTPVYPYTPPPAAKPAPETFTTHPEKFIKITPMLGIKKVPRPPKEA